VTKMDIEKWALGAHAMWDFLEEVAKDTEVSYEEDRDIRRVLKRAKFLIDRQARDGRDLSHDREEAIAIMRLTLQSLGGDPYGYGD